MIVPPAGLIWVWLYRPRRPLPLGKSAAPLPATVCPACRIRGAITGGAANLVPGVTNMRGKWGLPNDPKLRELRPDAGVGFLRRCLRNIGSPGTTQTSGGLRQDRAEGPERRICGTSGRRVRPKPPQTCAKAGRKARINESAEHRVAGNDPNFRMPAPGPCGGPGTRICGTSGRRERPKPPQTCAKTARARNDESAEHRVAGNDPNLRRL